LYPSNPDKVIKDIPKPVAEPTIAEPTIAEPTIPTLKTCEIDLCPQGEVLQTPVSSEALTSLHNLIKQDACAEDVMSKQSLQRHTQKLANAAQICFAERALHQEQIYFLRKVNNEAKVRRSTKPLVLGKAKVMSYEDLEEARAKRAAKDAAKAKGKGKRGRKRKSPAPEADALEPKAKVARRSEAPEPVRAPVAWLSEVQVAPVARMY
jgi:hypothetical protein